MGGIHTATAELYRLFSLANRDLWEGKLPTPQITIQTGKQGILGWCTVEKVWTGTEDRYEINIVAEHLSRGIFDTACTLLHEMVHLGNMAAGIRDTSGFQYHNRRFERAALAIGLLVEQIPRYGFARTTIGPRLREWLGDRPLDPDAFGLYRKASTSPRGSKTKQKKWSCGCTNVRCAVELHAVCTACDQPFALA
ncbi:MAG: hypothetical protein Q8N53_17430 [Longimicrobiales bacterium]|nr:hypothetical protein [Longimicrobiales bacterium]